MESWFYILHNSRPMSFIYSPPNQILFNTLLVFRKKLKMNYNVYYFTIISLSWYIDTKQKLIIRINNICFFFLIFLHSFATNLLFNVFFYFFFLISHRYGTIISTKAILDKTTNKCKGIFCFSPFFHQF